MPSRPRKGKTIIDPLVDLVDEDFNKRSHRPGIQVFPYLFVLAALVLMVPIVFYASSQTSEPTRTSLLAIGIATAGIALTYSVASARSLERSIRQERFSRICKKRRFKPIDNARNRLILHSLILIREKVPTTLRDAMPHMPDVFEEERLLQYAVVPYPLD